MTTTHQKNDWHRQEMERLRHERGYRCQFCPSVYVKLEWAHLRPTGLRGEGRGSNHRALDIKRHPERYVLLCVPCHRGLDAILAGF